MINRIFILTFISFSLFISSEASIKLYFDEQDIVQGDDGYYAHIGWNKWLITQNIYEEDGQICIYHDSFETEFNLDTLQAEYVNKWKCPYCHNYWPEQQACQNKDCPSRYGKKKKKEETRTNNRNETNVNRHDNEYDNRHLRDPVKPIKQPLVKHPPTNRKPITVSPVTRNPITTNRV